MAEHMMIDGKCINIYTCSRAREEQMERNGWHCVIPDRGFSNNRPEKVYEKCRAMGYEKIRVFYSGSMIRGIHNHFAWCK